MSVQNSDVPWSQPSPQPRARRFNEHVSQSSLFTGSINESFGTLRRNTNKSLDESHYEDSIPTDWEVLTGPPTPKRNRSTSVASDRSMRNEIDRSIAATRREDPTAINSIKVHQICPRCRGKGRIAKDAIAREELVALVPYNDERLKPKRTKQIVAATICVTLVTAIILAFFLWPRQVATDPIDTFIVRKFNGSNCVMDTFECRLRACENSEWPEVPCNISDPSTFYPQACEKNSYGCYCPERNCEDYNDCQSCSELRTEDSCRGQHQCAWNEGLCDGKTIGPLWFAFNYTVSVSNSNYFGAHLVDGLITLQYTDATIEGQTVQLPLAAVNLREHSVPARDTSELVVPINVSLPRWNSTGQKEENELLRDLLHDVCSKAAGKCINPSGSGDDPYREQFFLTFNLQLTASVLGQTTSLNENRLIGLRLACNHENDSSSRWKFDVDRATLEDRPVEV